MTQQVSFNLAIACLLLLSSCSSEKRGNRKETVPVIGEIVVDGQPPASPLKISCVEQNGIDTQNPSVSWCMTGDEGKFSLSTYESGDGVPPGDYVLTFFWGKLNLVSGSYGGPDRLKGRYRKPTSSPVKITAKAGEPIDLGRIELTTK